MVHYRRSRVPGGTYFFTVTLRDRKSVLLTDNIGLLRAAFRQVHRRRPYTLDAAVILPDHLHVVMALPDFDYDYSGRWRAIKSQFVRYLRRGGCRYGRLPVAVTVFGRRVSGNTSFAMRTIGAGTWITFIGTR